MFNKGGPLWAPFSHMPIPEKQKPIPRYGKIFFCDHPVYNECTLYKEGQNGLAVIQQKYNSRSKTTGWGPIDDNELVDKIYQESNFQWFFGRYSGQMDNNGCYPTVSLRQIMHALHMPPLPCQPWETVFDHKPF